MGRVAFSSPKQTYKPKDSFAVPRAIYSRISRRKQALGGSKQKGGVGMGVGPEKPPIGSPFFPGYSGLQVSGLAGHRLGSGDLHAWRGRLTQRSNLLPGGARAA